MNGECKGTIHQERGGLRVEFVANQCSQCNDAECFGKAAEASTKLDMSSAYYGKMGEAVDPIAPEEPEPLLLKKSSIERGLNALNTSYQEIVADIMDGKCTGFIIMTIGPKDGGLLATRREFITPYLRKNLMGNFLRRELALMGEISFRDVGIMLAKLLK